MAPRSNRASYGLEGSTPSPSALQPLADRHKASAPQADRRVRLPQGIWNVMIGDRLAVGRLALNQKTEVRALLPELDPTSPCLHETTIRDSCCW